MCHIHIYIQPIAARVAHNLEIISKNFQFSTRHTRIVIGFTISNSHYVVLIVNPMGRNMVRRFLFRNNLEILCHPICNWLQVIYIYIYTRLVCILSMDSGESRYNREVPDESYESSPRIVRDSYA